MDTKIGYCGYDCSTCLGWIAYQITSKKEQEEYLRNYQSVIPCAGCHAEENICEKTCGICAMRKCCIEKKVGTCTECNEYPCNNFNKGE
jgi:hypothetical protein